MNAPTPDDVTMITVFCTGAVRHRPHAQRLAWTWGRGDELQDRRPGRFALRTAGQFGDSRQATPADTVQARMLCATCGWSERVGPDLLAALQRAAVALHERGALPMAREHDGPDAGWAAALTDGVVASARGRC